MLSLYKNRVVTNAIQSQIEICQKELDWYSENLWTIASQSAVLMGFTLTQQITEIPEEAPTAWKVTYFFSLCIATGFFLCSLVSSTLSSIWGPALAIAGPKGAKSVYQAVDHLREQHVTMFVYFICGIFCFYLSNLALVWIHFSHMTCIIVMVPMGIIGLLILWYTFYFTFSLRVKEERAVNARIEQLEAYEDIEDIDEVRGKMYVPVERLRGEDTLMKKGGMQYANPFDATMMAESAPFNRPIVDTSKIDEKELGKTLLTTSEPEGVRRSVATFLEKLFR